MQNTVSRFTKALAIAALSVGALGCDRAPQSAAADVSGADVRHLPPDRQGTLPDVMVVKADHQRTLGADSVRLTLLVISDYQCTACRTWFERAMPIIRAEYVDRGALRLVWAHYPLREHPAAVRAASAAMCAGAQEKFWEASAQLFATQARWGASPDTSTLIDSIASVPGLDPMMLASCTSSQRMLRQIRHDIDWANTAKAGAPPTIVVGKHVLSGSAPVTALRAVIDSALAGR